MAACDPTTEVQNGLVFAPYEKMPPNLVSSWRKDSGKLDKIKKWVALEKIHGANFSFTVQARGSDEEIAPARAAKRSGFLKTGENFFNLSKHPEFLKEEGEKAEKLFVTLKAEHYMDATSVTVFGELFGGSYPHPDVPSVPNAVPVQQEVVYCPELRFIAYDIAVTHGDNCREYLDYDVCMELFKIAEFLYSEPLMCGTLQDMFTIELGFETKLPAKFGLPPLQDRPNVAEGVVIKPLRNLVLETTKLVPQRVIFKRKVEHFHERRRPRGQTPNGKTGGKKGKNKGSGEDHTHQDNLRLIQYEMNALVSDQRIVNTISKQGIPDSDSEWTELTEALLQDVLETTEYENEELWETCRGSSGGLETILGGLREECTQAVDEYRITHFMAKTKIS